MIYTPGDFEQSYDDSLPPDSYHDWIVYIYLYVIVTIVRYIIIRLVHCLQPRTAAVANHDVRRVANALRRV